MIIECALNGGIIILAVLEIINTYRPAFLQGLWVTLKLVSIIWFLGIVFGSAFGWLGARFSSTVGAISWIGSFLLSGIPVLVFLFWLHYPAQSILNVVVDPFYTAALTFSVINIFSVSELVRVHLLEFPKQYLLAAKVCGLSQQQMAWHIVFPIVLRQILPSMLMLQVSMLHITLFASLISVEELFRVAQRINSSIYKPVEIYTALGLFFLLVSLPINALALWMKRRFTRNLSEK